MRAFVELRVGFLLKKMHQLVKGGKRSYGMFVEETQKNQKVTVKDSKKVDVTQKGCRRATDWVMN